MQTRGETSTTRRGATAGAVAGIGRPAERAAERRVDQRRLLTALTRFRKGDFSVRLPDTWTGEAAKIADSFNDIAELNERMAAELARMARVVGKEGKILQRASLGDVRGGWHASIDCVNSLIGDLVHPTSETARVIGAVAKGDLSQSMALEKEGRALEGEFLRTATTVNTMVDQLSSFAAEVTRVAREVGTEGKLGGQAKVRGVAGTWKDLTDNVNLMAGNLTGQVRNIAAVTTALAKGDLTKKITVDVRGEFLELKNTVNTMVDQLSSFAAEVTRVAREVGTEGKLGGQADVRGVAGTWKDLTDSVNSMAGNLTAQVRNIADVTTAVANGDLSRKVTVDVKGEILELKDKINTMVDQLRSFASEVTRVAREVGTEGQARRPGEGRRRVGHLEGPHGQRELDGGQPHGPGAKYRRGHDRRRERRSLQEDHGRRRRRNPRAQRHDQHDGGPALLFRLGGDARRARGGNGRETGRPGAGQGRGRNVERSDRQRELHGRQPDRPGAKHRGRDEGRRERRPLAQDHGGREGRDPRAQEHGQHDGRPALVVRGGGDPRRARSRNGRQARRPGGRARRGGHVERSDGLGQLDGGQPDRPGAKHRRGDDGRRERQPLQENHGGREGRDPRAERHDQHDGGPAAVVRVRGDARRARGGHRRPARRTGLRSRRRRHVEGPDRQRELHGRQPDRPGAKHRGRDEGRCERRPHEEDHGGREGRDPRAQEHGQHDGGPAFVVRFRGDARRARGGHGRQARRPGGGGRSLGDLERPHGQREFHGGQSHRAGARHRARRDRRRERGPHAPADGRRERGDRGARGHDQQHDRHARDVRGPGDERRARGGSRGQARRPGERARRRGNLEGPDRQRQPARREPHDPGPRDRGGRDRRDEGRPHTVDQRRRPRRGRGPQGQHQRDDPQPQGHDAQEQRTGLVEDEPREVLPDAPGAARSAHRRPPDPFGARASRLGATGRLLHAGHVGRAARPAPARELRDDAAKAGPRARRGSHRAVRRGESEDPAAARAARLHPYFFRARRSGSPECHRAPGRVRGTGQSRARARDVRRVQPDPPGVSRPADGIDRHRVEHDRGEHADGDPPRPVAVARPRAAAPAGRASADEPGARRKGRPARRAERGGRTQEPGGRTGPPGAGGEGEAAGSDVEVQVGIPREHVPRAADAAELAADPLRPAHPQPRWKPDAEADGIREDDPFGRQRPAEPDQ